MTAAARQKCLLPVFKAFAAFLFSISTAVLAAEPEFDATTGYRIARYRSPVPATVPGGTAITAAEVAGLVKNHNAILIDVMRSDGAGPDPQTGMWRTSTPRQNLPGSTWLPDVGIGKLSPAMDTYFRNNLGKLTAEDTSRAVILYCQADCWMSWNAVKRAASYGYTQLYWFSEGSDGWRDWDGTFAAGVPVPLFPAAELKNGAAGGD